MGQGIVGEIIGKGLARIAQHIVAALAEQDHGLRQQSRDRLGPTARIETKHRGRQDRRAKAVLTMAKRERG